MNFLNPLYLFALGAVAVPILIHIFSRRRVPEVPFSTIRFLKRSDRRSMTRINLRRLVLLMIRMLAIAVLALALARPVVRGSLAALFPAGGSRAACILIDRSFSMGVEGEGGTALERALARVRALLDNLDRADAVSIVLFDAAPEVLYDGAFDRAAVLASLKGIAPSWRGTDLRSAVAFGQRILEGTKREARELYIVSDFQRTSLGAAPARGEGAGAARGESSSAAKNARAALPVRALLIPVQTAGAANVAVENVLAPRVTLHKGETAEVTIVFRNMSRELPAKFPLEILVGGRRIMEKEIEMLPDGYFRATASIRAERTGWIEGIVTKRSDRLPADDTRYFTLQSREKTRVLLMADENGFYLEQALSPGGYEGDIAVVVRGWRTFTTLDLDAADVVLLGPGKGPDASAAATIDRFVHAGGKAIVLLLPELRAAAERLSRYPLRFEFAETAHGYWAIAKPAGPVGFLAPFDTEDLAALARVRFRSAALVRGVPAGVAQLAFSSGSPFVWEEERGEGSVVFTALDPRPEAGELVLSPQFLPLVQQLVLATGMKPPAAEGHLVGEPILWKGAVDGDVVCELPGGRSLRPERIEQRASGGAGDLLIPDVDRPGIVTVLADSAVRGKIAVNPDCRRESDLTYIAAREAADSLGLGNQLVVEEGEPLAAAIRVAREGREIATPLVILAAALFLAELAIAQREKGESA